ncbi:MAG: hypothetical protein V4737_14975 [Curtobacterium sp.]
MTDWVLSITSRAARPISFLAAIVVWAAILAVFTSLIAAPVRFASRSPRSRARRRYLRAAARLTAGASPEADAGVGWVILEMRSAQRLEALLAVFGGRFIVASPFEISLSIREALRAGALVVGVVCALVTWPVTESWRPESWWVASVNWDSIRLALPLLVLAIGVVMVVPRAPLLDRIRARDEAAKDANRLLARWSYAASRYSDVLSRQARELHSMAAGLVNERLAEFHPSLGYFGGHLTDERDGEERGHEIARRRRTSNVGAQTRQPELDALRALNVEILVAGLGDVARALIPSAWPFVVASGEHWMIDEDAPNGAVAHDERPFYRHLLARLTAASAEAYDRARRGAGSEVVAERQRLESLVREVEEQIRLRALDMELRSSCLAVAAAGLSHRLLGSSWTRLLSAVKS